MIKDTIAQMERYAKDNNVPIMLPDGIEFLLNYIKENNIKSILEIGTAIGYSAIRMGLVSKEIKITTIERDEIRYKEAISNISKFGLQDQIKVLFKDAFDVQLNDKYGLIFIDAAKSQYIKFFEKFKCNLEEGGTIISDNLSFHGLVEHKDDEKLSRNVRGLVRKINEYIDFLKNNEEFKTQFFSVGDGIGVSIRKDNKN